MQTETLTDKCYSLLLQDITEGKYKPDDWIVENDICKTLGVSKATAREALHRLAQEGLIRSYPRKGYKLNVYNDADFLRIQRLRFVIESLVVHRIIKDVETSEIKKLFPPDGPVLNHDFHMGLAKLCQDTFIEDTLDGLLTKADGTFSNIAFRDNSNREIENRHRELLKALMEKNEEKALAALKTDLCLEKDEEFFDAPVLWKSRRAFSAGSMDEIVYLSDPQISPDGKRALLTEYKARVEDGRFLPAVWMIDLKTGEKYPLAEGDLSAEVSAEGNLPAEGELSAKKRLSECTRHPRFLADGRIAYLSDRSGEYQIWILEDGKLPRQLTTVRHGILNFDYCTQTDYFCFEAPLWETEIEEGLTFTEMTPEQKAAWKKKKEWEPVEITTIDYKRDECKGVLDGSISCIGIVSPDGKQRILPQRLTGTDQTGGWRKSQKPTVQDEQRDSGAAWRKTNGRVPCHLPVFSPDGKQIACYGQIYTGAHYSSQELLLADCADVLTDCKGLSAESGDGSAAGKDVTLRQLTSRAFLTADVPAAFTEDGAALVYPFYYFENGGSTVWLNKLNLSDGTTTCLFRDSEKEGPGLENLASSRTQYGDEKPYFTVDGKYAWFLGYEKGTERLYRISLKGNSAPELVAGGAFSIHEFCLPVKGNLLLTRGDYRTIRDLYLYHVRSGSFRRVLDSNPWLNECSLGETEELDVPSRDGKVTIHGRVCLPARFEEGKKYPAVLYIHGGPTVCFTNDFWHEIQILSNAGYVVITCDPRGSYGYGLSFSNEEDSWGESAYEDLMQFLDAVIAKGYVDEKRVGITGGSYGGYMTCKIIMKTDRFAAAAGQRVFVNKATSYGTGDIGFYSAAMDYRDVNVRKCLTDRARTSIIRDMDKIRTPLLLLHGYQDYRCSFEQAEQMFISIKERRRDVPVRLVMFPGENHGVSRTGLLHFQKRHIQEIVDWFDTYLKGTQNGGEKEKQL
ncbi:MAG: prolyl oligopeptidase family serine peptidase [Lachnospiraceae bacterium]|nr:prolyl oligopeptidase family serine peptidase [Lachnospiraceae bacterium]